MQDTKNEPAAKSWQERAEDAKRARLYKTLSRVADEDAKPVPGLDHPAVQRSVARYSDNDPAPQHEAYAQGGWTTWSHERGAYVWKGTHAERVAKRIAEYEAAARVRAVRHEGGRGMNAKTYSVQTKRESLSVTVYGGPDVPDLDTEAEHVAEAIAALKDARWHFDRIKGASNRVMVSFHLPRIEAAMDRERKERERISANAHLRAERYKAEAIGFACKSALGIPAKIHAYRLAAIDHEERAERAAAERVAQREREAAIFRGATLAVENRRPRAKVSDASLIAEVKTKRHGSISDLARAIGLATPTTWNRLNALVQAGKLAADEVPRGTCGRGNRKGAK